MCRPALDACVSLAETDAGANLLDCILVSDYACGQKTQYETCGGSDNQGL